MNDITGEQIQQEREGAARIMWVRYATCRFPANPFLTPRSLEVVAKSRKPLKSYATVQGMKETSLKK